MVTKLKFTITSTTPGSLIRHFEYKKGKLSENMPNFLSNPVWNKEKGVKPFCCI